MMARMTGRTNEAVAATIRAEAARRNLSQRDLASELGMSQATFWRRMSGAQAFDLDELDAIAGHFEMDIRDLLPAATSTATP